MLHESPVLYTIQPEPTETLWITSPCVEWPIMRGARMEVWKSCLLLLLVLPTLTDSIRDGENSRVDWYFKFKNEHAVPNCLRVEILLFKVVFSHVTRPQKNSFCFPLSQPLNFDAHIVLPELLRPLSKAVNIGRYAPTTCCQSFSAPSLKLWIRYDICPQCVARAPLPPPL